MRRKEVSLKLGLPNLMTVGRRWAVQVPGWSYRSSISVDSQGSLWVLTESCWPQTGLGLRSIYLQPDSDNHSGTRCSRLRVLLVPCTLLLASWCRTLSLGRWDVRKWGEEEAGEQLCKLLRSHFLLGRFRERGKCFQSGSWIWTGESSHIRLRIVSYQMVSSIRMWLEG